MWNVQSIRGNLRNNKQYLKVQQYSSDPRDLGQMNHDEYAAALTGIYSGIYPLMKRRAHVVINVNDVWENDKRYPTHVYVMKALEAAGFEFRNTIMWDKRPLVNKVGIFGWPSNFITLEATNRSVFSMVSPDRILNDYFNNRGTDKTSKYVCNSSQISTTLID